MTRLAAAHLGGLAVGKQIAQCSSSSCSLSDCIWHLVGRRLAQLAEQGSQAPAQHSGRRYQAAALLDPRHGGLLPCRPARRSVEPLICNLDSGLRSGNEVDGGAGQHPGGLQASMLGRAQPAPKGMPSLAFSIQQADLCQAPLCQQSSQQLAAGHLQGMPCCCAVGMHSSRGNHQGKWHCLLLLLSIQLHPQQNGIACRRTPCIVALAEACAEWPGQTGQCLPASAACCTMSWHCCQAAACQVCMTPGGLSDAAAA